jgi:hypothetical protein
MMHASTHVVQIARLAQERAGQRVSAKIRSEADVEGLMDVPKKVRKELQGFVLLCASLRRDALGVVQHGGVQAHVVRAVRGLRQTKAANFVGNDFQNKRRTSPNVT